LTETPSEYLIWCKLHFTTCIDSISLSCVCVHSTQPRLDKPGSGDVVY